MQLPAAGAAELCCCPATCGLQEALEEAMTAGERTWRAMQVFDAGCRRSRARECWRCCKLVLPAGKARRPSPRLTRRRPIGAGGDSGIDDGVILEAGYIEEAHASTVATPCLLASSAFSNFDDGCSAASSSSTARPEREELEARCVSELREQLKVEAGIRDAPEDLLHCCCRVSRYTVSLAFQRACAILEWREREGVDLILANPTALAEERSWRPLLRYGLPGRDRKSRPVMIQAVGRWDMKALNTAMRDRKNELLRSHVVLYETLRKQSLEALLAPQEHACGKAGEDCGRRRPHPARWVFVLDMEGLSLWHTRYPEVLACLKEVSALGSKYYPETIDRMFVVNASAGFHMIWRLVARFLKPNTRAKVRVLPEGDCRELVAECGAACIPVQFGGHLPGHLLPHVAH